MPGGSTSAMSRGRPISGSDSGNSTRAAIPSSTPLKAISGHSSSPARYQARRASRSSRQA